MSDEAQRIGNGEREAAVAALQVHRTAGRLDSTEYEERSVQANQARTWADLTPLFADLPEPHPRPGATPAGTPLTSTASMPTQPEPPATASLPTQRPGTGLVSEPWAAWIMALTPFVVLLLFFVTGDHWEWFLAIPIVGLIVYGPKNRDRDRNRDRRRNR
jgi:hypothetical protein